MSESNPNRVIEINPENARQFAEVIISSIRAEFDRLVEENLTSSTDKQILTRNSFVTAVAINKFAINKLISARESLNDSNDAPSFNQALIIAVKKFVDQELVQINHKIKIITLELLKNHFESKLNEKSIERDMFGELLLYLHNEFPNYSYRLKELEARIAPKHEQTEILDAEGKRVEINYYEGMDISPEERKRIEQEISSLKENIKNMSADMTFILFNKPDWRLNWDNILNTILNHNQLTLDDIYKIIDPKGIKRSQNRFRFDSSTIDSSYILTGSAIYVIGIIIFIALHLGGTEIKEQYQENMLTFMTILAPIFFLGIPVVDNLQLNAFLIKERIKLRNEAHKMFDLLLEILESIKLSYEETASSNEGKYPYTENDLAGLSDIRNQEDISNLNIINRAES